MPVHSRKPVQNYVEHLKRTTGHVHLGFLLSLCSVMHRLIDYANSVRLSDPSSPEFYSCRCLANIPKHVFAGIAQLSQLGYEVQQQPTGHTDRLIAKL